MLWPSPKRGPQGSDDPSFLVGPARLAGGSVDAAVGRRAKQMADDMVSQCDNVVMPSPQRDQ